MELCSPVVDSLAVGLVAGILFAVDLAVDNRLVGSLLVDNLVVVVVGGVVVAADRMVEDAIAVGIPMVDSSMMVIVDRIDRDSWFGDFDNWQLVMAGDIVQLDYVQMDYSHRSDNEDEAMVDDAEVEGPAIDE